MVEKKIGRSSRDYVKPEPTRKRPADMTQNELTEYIEQCVQSRGERRLILVGELSEMTLVGLDQLSNLLQLRPELRQLWNVTSKKNTKKGGRRSRCGLPS